MITHKADRVEQIRVALRRTMGARQWTGYRLAKEMKVRPAVVYKLIRGDTTPDLKTLLNATNKLGLFIQFVDIHETPKNPIQNDEKESNERE